MLESFEYDKFKDKLDKARNIVILPHTSPDGDALGSSFALCLILRKIFKDKNINVLSPDNVEDYLVWMMSFMDNVYIWGNDVSERLLRNADLLIHLDHNDIKRLRHEDLISLTRGKQNIVIDHHLGKVFNADVLFCNPDASSTCEVVFYIIDNCSWSGYIDKNIATMILTGIITDTGRFLYECNGNTFYVVSRLIGCHADMNCINDSLNYHKPLNRVRLHSFLIDKRMEIYGDIGLAVISVTKEDLNAYHSIKGDTEGLVNTPLEIEGVSISCMLREDNDFIKLSLRSIGDFSVNDIAQHFGGGGHLNAAGGEFFGNMTDAKNKLIEVIKNKLMI